MIFLAPSTQSPIPTLCRVTLQGEGRVQLISSAVLGFRLKTRRVNL